MVKSTPARLAEFSLLGLFAFMMVWMPLPLGSNRVWSTAFLAVILVGIALFALLTETFFTCRSSADPASIPDGRSAAAIFPLVFLGAYAAWSANPLIRSALSGQAGPFDTQFYMLRWVACLGGAACIACLAHSPRRRLFVLQGVLATGVLQAVLALLLLARRTPVQIFGTPLEMVGRATGTFTNSDHLALFLIMALCAGIGIMLAQLGAGHAQRSQRWSDHVVQVLQFVLSPKMLVRLLLVVMVVALVLTRSRAGNGIFFGALFLLSAWVMIVSARLRKPAAWLVASLLVVDIIVLGQWVGLDKVVQRLDATDLSIAQKEALEQKQHSTIDAPPASAFRQESLEERLSVAKDSLRLIEKEPVWGHGGGTFYLTIPMVKSWDRPWRFDHAHCDYAEIAVDTGLVGLALLLTLYGATLWRCVKLVGDHTPAIDRGIAAGVGLALVCAALHAWVDFNLQITANAVMINILSALVWAIPMPERHKTSQPVQISS